MLRRRLAAAAVSLALVSGLAASPAHAAMPSAAGGTNGQPCKQQQCNIPEAPLPIGLPIAGLVVLGGYVVLMRRREPAEQSAGISGTR